MDNNRNKVLRSNSLSKGYRQYTVTINNLKEWKIQGEQLTSEQTQALHNFESYSDRFLDQTTDDREFQKRYLEISSLANLTHFTEFLKEKYQTLS